MKRLRIVTTGFLVIFTFFINPPSEAQNLAFNTDGLYNAELLDNIYRGHFENIQLTRNDTDFFKLYAKYLRVYGEGCAEYLPEDKEMIMNEVCDLWEVKTNHYGAEISRNCLKWKKEPSNIYADRDLYEAQLEL